jgi:hypothetical protein
MVPGPLVWRICRKNQSRFQTDDLFVGMEPTCNRNCGRRQAQGCIACVVSWKCKTNWSKVKTRWSKTSGLFFPKERAEQSRPGTWHLHSGSPTAVDAQSSCSVLLSGRLTLSRDSPANNWPGSKEQGMLLCTQNLNQVIPRASLVRCFSVDFQFMHELCSTNYFWHL